MGLLDILNNPDNAQALGLLGQGIANRNVTGGANAAMSLLAGADQRRLQQQMMQMQMEAQRAQMEDMQRQRTTQASLLDAARQSVISPDKATAMSMGPMPDGSNMPTVQPGLDTSSFINRAFQIDPFKAIELQGQLVKQKPAPIKLGAGDTLLDPTTNKPIYTAPKEDAPPADWKLYQLSGAQQRGMTFDQWDQARKKAGANNVSLSVSTEKNLLSDIAGGLGKSMVDARSSAQGAVGTINTVNRLNDALNSGKVMAGPGTSFRQAGLQLGQMLGVAGNNAQETLVNTRQAIQSLAQLELDAAQQMKGQGQITEAERSIIRRAASGDIDGMTVPELRLLGGVLDRTARFKIQNYNRQVEPLVKNPNAAALAPFLNVDEPTAAQPTQGGPVRRYNPATGRIE